MGTAMVERPFCFTISLLSCRRTTWPGAYSLWHLWFLVKHGPRRWCDAINDPRLLHPIPVVTSAGVSSLEGEPRVATDADVRGAVLVERGSPSILHLDSLAFARDSSKQLPGLGVTYAD